MDIYTEKDTDIIHTTSVDFVLRPCSKEIHIVQYDKSLPIIKVELYSDGKRYILPETATSYLRLTKLDNTFVYESALGYNESRDTLYFEVNEQMATLPGELWVALEINIDNKVACGSLLKFIIDRNPVQPDQIESKDYYPVITELQSDVATLKSEINLNDLKALIAYAKSKGWIS